MMDKWSQSTQHCQGPLPINCGVQQGSILRPLLFGIHINDLSSALRKCSVQSYLDDTKLVIAYKMKDALNAFADLRDDLHRIGRWCSKNLIVQPKQN